MKVEEREKVIPSYVKKETIYIAIDGTEFKKERDCINYDEDLIKYYDVIINQIDYARTFEGYDAVIFNIKNDKDLEAVKMLKNYYKVIDDYDKYGPGLYIWWEDPFDEDCYKPDSYLKNYKAYLTSCEIMYKDMVDDNARKIKEVYGEDITGR